MPACCKTVIHCVTKRLVQFAFGLAFLADQCRDELELPEEAVVLRTDFD